MRVQRFRLVVGTSLVVQWLRICGSNAGSMGSIPGQGPEITNATQLDLNIFLKKEDFITWLKNVLQLFHLKC